MLSIENGHTSLIATNAHKRHLIDFGDLLSMGGSGGLLVQSTLAGLGIEVELAQLAAIEIPVCIIATVVAIVFYVIKDRKMIQKYYK